jgi:hypothetical protein
MYVSELAAIHPLAMWAADVRLGRWRKKQVYYRTDGMLESAETHPIRIEIRDNHILNQPFKGIHSVFSHVLSRVDFGL